MPKAELACKLRQSILGKQQRDYLTDLSNFALLHSSLGDYGAAEPRFVEAREIREMILGKNHPDHATDLGNLAGLYSKMGAYARAEPLYAAACAIHKQTQGAESPAYAISLNNLAFHYAKTGDFARAETLFLQAREINKVALGEDHADYALSLNNLAELYSSMQDYARAEPLFLQARDIRKKALSENHPSYATSLDNLAGLYAVQRKYAQAEPLYVQALDIRRRTLGEKHPAYALSLNNLAGLYFDQGDCARAAPLFVEAGNLRRRLLGDYHPDYAQSVSNLALLYAATGFQSQAEPLYREALRITRRVLESTASVQSERQQLAMGQSLRARLDSYVSFGLASNGYPRRVFGEVLAWKGATLVRQRGMRLAADDPAVGELFGKLQRTARQLASLSRALPEKDDVQAAWRKQIAELAAAQEQLEAELSAKSAAFRQATREVTVDDLLAALPQDAVLVDYLEFDRSTPPGPDGRKATWRREFVVFVVRHAEKPEDQVTMIALGSAAPVSAAIDAWRANFGMSDVGLAAGRQLRAALWEPLLPAIGAADEVVKKQTILISTDGVLGRLPLGALPGREPGKYLLEEHRLAMIPVPQLIPTLVNTAGRHELVRELLLLGDVDYDAAPGDVAMPPKKKQPRRPRDTSRSPAEGKLFEPLANTAGEIASIERLYGQLFDIRPNDPFSLVRQQADEARFRELAPQYRHLHLATHGFFAEAGYASSLKSQTARDAQRDADPDTPLIGHNPGLLSGLALACANREPTADMNAGAAADRDDGILTAQEIGVMNLAGVDTVVLSACDTGLGETAGGEGLLGVQRAFQTAGVRTTIASYWKVDDLVTRLLMERFYRNLWEQEMSHLDALREAQLYVLKHPEAIRGADAPEEAVVRTSPRFWAAFSLSGDWR